MTRPPTPPVALGRLSLALAAALFVATGCDNDYSPIPVGPPSPHVVGDRFVGAWAMENSDDPDALPFGYYVAHFNDTEYLVMLVDTLGGDGLAQMIFGGPYPSGTERHGVNLPFLFRGHLTVLEGATFLNLRPLAADPLYPREELEELFWIILRLDMVGDRIRVRQLETSQLEPRPLTSEALQRALAGRVDEDDLYNSDGTEFRRLPLWSSSPTRTPGLP
jgi:hypothetical protein